MTTRVEIADFAGLHLQRLGYYVGGRPMEEHLFGLHTRFVDQTLRPLHKVSGEQETAPFRPRIDTQSSENKLEQHATWRRHRVRAEAIFALPYSGLSGLRPLMTGGC